MSERYPVTPAIRFLRSRKIGFVPHEYPYIDHGGTAQSARALGIDEHLVVKTIVLEDENHNPLIMLMHGDCEISTRSLARQISARHIAAADPAQVGRITGYQTGGCSPFGTRRALPVYAEKSLFALEKIYINGGKRGFLVEISPQDLRVLNPVEVSAAAGR